MDRPAASRRDQTLDLLVLALLYGLQVFNAEMLRRSLGLDQPGQPGQPGQILLNGAVAWITDRLHPFSMGVLGVWLVVLAITIACGKKPPRWAFDGPGLWLVLRLVLEFLIINVLIFQPALVQPGVLLGQIVVYLPYFVITWGWVFHRLDWVNRSEPGLVVQLNDVPAAQPVSRFDYFHSAINTLLNKGKPTISGVNRIGRIAVLVFNGMLLGLYAVAFARVLQLTKAAL